MITILIAIIVLETVWIMFGKKFTCYLETDVEFLKNRLTVLENDVYGDYAALEKLPKTIISRLNVLEEKIKGKVETDMNKVYGEVYSDATKIAADTIKRD